MGSDLWAVSWCLDALCPGPGQPPWAEASPAWAVSSSPALTCSGVLGARQALWASVSQCVQWGASPQESKLGRRGSPEMGGLPEQELDVLTHVSRAISRRPKQGAAEPSSSHSCWGLVGSALLKNLHFQGFGPFCAFS